MDAPLKDDGASESPDARSPSAAPALPALAGAQFSPPQSAAGSAASSAVPALDLHHHHPPLPDANGGGSKRKRVSLACNACRLRKSKVRLSAVRCRARGYAVGACRPR